MSLHFFPPVRLSEIEYGTNGNDPGRIDLGMRHVVMALDVVEVDSIEIGRAHV